MNKNIIQANLYYQLLSPELISNQTKLNELIQKAKELDKKFDNAESQFTLILGYLRSNLPDKAMSELTDQKMPLDWSLQRPAWRWIAGKTLEANDIDNFNPLISVQNLDSASRAERESLVSFLGLKTGFRIKKFNSPSLKYLNQLIMGFSTLLPWSLLFWQLSTIWEINEQYSHGFIVPVIMIYLILKIPSLPFHEPTQNGSSKIDFYFVLGTLLIFLLFPIWIIRSANPDWRLLNVVFFLTVLLFSFLCIYRDGGWEKLSIFFFHCCFLQ